LLFLVKKSSVAAWVSAILLLSVWLVAGDRPGAIAQSRFDLETVALALGAVALSDALLHGSLLLAFREGYARRYRRLALLFRSQSAAAIVAGGALAAVEELVFRGMLLQGLLDAGAGPAVAVAASATVFGLFHLIADRKLAPFALWEGALLGGVYVVGGSLAVSMVVHATHDISGFALFALQRRTGWMMR